MKTIITTMAIVLLLSLPMYAKADEFVAPKVIDANTIEFDDVPYYRHGNRSDGYAMDVTVYRSRNNGDIMRTELFAQDWAWFIVKNTNNMTDESNYVAIDSDCDGTFETIRRGKDVEAADFPPDCFTARPEI